MTYKEFKQGLSYLPRPIRWDKSGVIEFARLDQGGSVVITNAITRKSYRWPRRYNQIHVSFVADTYVTVWELLPKCLR